MLCASSFTDDVMFSYHRANGPESSTTLFRRVRQVALPVGHQTTAGFGRVLQNAAPEAKSAIYSQTAFDTGNHEILEMRGREPSV